MKTEIIGTSSPFRLQMMERIADFVEVDSITYVDHGKAEEYIFTKGNKTFTLTANYNPIDGGYLTIK